MGGFYFEKTFSWNEIFDQMDKELKGYYNDNKEEIYNKIIELLVNFKDDEYFKKEFYYSFKTLFTEDKYIIEYAKDDSKKSKDDEFNYSFLEELMKVINFDGLKAGINYLKKYFTKK